MEMKWYNFQLPEDLHQALKEEAVARRVPLKELIILYLRLGLRADAESENV